MGAAFSKSYSDANKSSYESNKTMFSYYWMQLKRMALAHRDDFICLN